MNIVELNKSFKNDCEFNFHAEIEDDLDTSVYDSYGNLLFKLNTDNDLITTKFMNENYVACDVFVFMVDYMKTDVKERAMEGLINKANKELKNGGLLYIEKLSKDMLSIKNIYTPDKDAYIIEDIYSENPSIYPTNNSVVLHSKEINVLRNLFMRINEETILI